MKPGNRSEFVRKIAVEKDGILFSKSRIMDGQRFQVASGLEDLEFMESLYSPRFGLSFMNPVLDRYSPVAYAIARHIHQKVIPHRGYEMCYRASLDHVYIIQGLNLFREIGEECVTCLKARRKFLDTSMGPLPEATFTVAPCFYSCQVDIFGPCQVFVPGHSFALRNPKIIESKVFILVFVCLVTKCVNLQVIENKSADAIIEGINRLS